MNFMAYLAVFCWGIAIGGIMWYCLNVARQITYVTLADGRRQERRLPLTFRLLLPLLHNLNPIVSQPVFTKTSEQGEKKLISAGFEGLLNGREFAAMKIAFPLVFGTAWLLVLRLLTHILPTISENFLLLLICGIALLYFYPIFWLRQAVAIRHRSIQRALPFVLDLLTLAVEAGLDFMTALQRNTDRRRLDPLNEELIRMIREIQLGTPRRVALRNMSQRVDLADLRSVTYALIQADELGVSIGAILRIQSDQLRQRRFDRAEKLAHEAPVKMLAPLMLFIFPAVFIVLLGPILSGVVVNLF